MSSIKALCGADSMHVRMGRNYARRCTFAQQSICTCLGDLLLFVLTEHQLQARPVVSQLVNVVTWDTAPKRKSRRGKEHRLHQAIAAIHALRFNHAQMTSLQHSLIRQRNRAVNTDIADAQSDDALCSASRIHLNELHLLSFSCSDVARCLIPFDFTESSTLVDCTESFANLFVVDRPRLIRGFTLSAICAHSSFLRLQSLVPMISSFGAVYVQNLPEYLGGMCCDMVISTEVDALPSELDCHHRGEASAKRRSIRRFLQIIITNRRRMGPRVDELAAASVDGAIRYPAADPVDGRRKISEHKTCPASQNTFTYSCPTDTCSTFADSHCAHDISSTHTTRPAVVAVPYALTARMNDAASESPEAWISPWCCDRNGVQGRRTSKLGARRHERGVLVCAGLPD